MPGHRSTLWSFFTRDPTGKTAKCSLCKQVMSVERSTYSNLRRHIMRKHPSMQSQVPPRVREGNNAMWKHFIKEPEKQARCRHCGSVLTYKYTTSSLGRHMRNKHAKILMAEQVQPDTEDQLEEYEDVYEQFPHHSDDGSQGEARAFDDAMSASESDGEMECQGGLIELQPVQNDELTEPIKLEIVDLNPEPTVNDDSEHDLIEGSMHHHQVDSPTQYDEVPLLHHQEELTPEDELTEVIEETVIGHIMDQATPARVNEDDDLKASAGCLISSSMKHINTKVATFAVHTALEMEGLAPQQRIIAQKLVSDILFNAKLDNLDENSMVIVRVGTFERE